MLTPLVSQAELKSFLQFHRTGEEPLRDDEISILNGVLELNTKHVEEIMTPVAVSAPLTFRPRSLPFSLIDLLLLYSLRIFHSTFVLGVYYSVPLSPPFPYPATFSASLLNFDRSSLLALPTYSIHPARPACISA
jgi:hypothetical protein